jgi:hypothetical protein
MLPSQGATYPAYTPSDEAAPTRTRSTASKLALLAGSIGLIRLIAGTWITPAFILALVIACYVAIILFDTQVQQDRLRRRLGWLWVIGVLGALIAANMSGLLSTLTGTSDSLDGQWPLMLGISSTRCR